MIIQTPFFYFNSYMSKMIVDEQGDATLSAKNDSDGANFIITLKGEIYVDLEVLKNN